MLAVKTAFLPFEIHFHVKTMHFRLRANDILMKQGNRIKSHVSETNAG
jgi:hypothetical protein